MNHKNITKVVLSHHPACSWHNVVDTKNRENTDFNSILHDGFVRTYKTLTKAGKDIYVVIDNPPFYKNLTKCKAAVIRRPVNIPLFLSAKNETMCSVKKSELEDKEIMDYWSRTARETSTGYSNIHFIDLKDVLCTKGSCSLLDDKDRILYQDGQHLNLTGSIYVANFILKKLQE